MEKEDLIDRVENETIKRAVYIWAIIIPGIFFINLIRFIEFKLFGVLDYFSIIHILFDFTFFYLCLISFKPTRNFLLKTFFKQYLK